MLRFPTTVAGGNMSLSAEWLWPTLCLFTAVVTEGVYLVVTALNVDLFARPRAVALPGGTGGPVRAPRLQRLQHLHARLQAPGLPWSHSAEDEDAPALRTGSLLQQRLREGQ